MANLIAKSSTTIDAPKAKIWRALVTPADIKRYMFDTTVTSDFRKGSPIRWKGEWQGQAYEDKGTILEVVPERTLRYSHFSPLAGLPDKPENYHTVTIDVTDDGGRTRVALSQDGNATEEAKAHAEKNWSMMLDGLKKLMEGR